MQQPFDQLYSGAHELDGISDDLLILSKWVKKELFVKVKFLYNQEKDLKIDGHIYNLFISTCKDRLIGMKVHASKSDEFKDQYIRALWARAAYNKKNVVTEALNTRRSGVYSATQNRFTGTLSVFCSRIVKNN
jgi:hypothetical protein